MPDSPTMKLSARCKRTTRRPTTAVIATLVLALASAAALAQQGEQSSTHAAASAKRLLPLGNGHVSPEPRVGYVYSCRTTFNGRGAHGGPWITGSEWDPAAKPVVSGSVVWPNASITITREGDQRIIRANNLPTHPTGVFPIRSTDSAYHYDRNPNAIREQNILLTLPAVPTAAATPSCLPMGMIGFAVTGVALYNALDAAGMDAVANEIQDHCNGHPQMFGQYHYHNASTCMADSAGAHGKHSDLLGYALDGYGIYGVHGEHGEVLTNADLDACHGHEHAIEWDGRMVRMYHYHATAEYPYTIGCFHGTAQRNGGPRNDGNAERRN